MHTHECTHMYAQCAVNRLLGNRRSTWLPAVVIFHFIQQHVSTDKMAVTMKTPWLFLLLNGSFVFAFFCCVNTVMVSLADNYGSNVVVFFSSCRLTQTPAGPVTSVCVCPCVCEFMSV